MKRLVTTINRIAYFNAKEIILRNGGDINQTICNLVVFYSKVDDEKKLEIIGIEEPKSDTHKYGITFDDKIKELYIQVNYKKHSNSLLNKLLIYFAQASDKEQRQLIFIPQ